MNTNPLIKRMADMEAIAIGEEWIVLHTDRLTVTKMNEVGSFIWSELKADGDVGSLARKLQERYEIDEATASRDVQLFVSDLEKVGLITYAS